LYTVSNAAARRSTVDRAREVVILDIVAATTVVEYMTRRESMPIFLRANRPSVTDGTQTAPTSPIVVRVVAAGIGSIPRVDDVDGRRHGMLWSLIPLRSLWSWIAIVTSLVRVDVVTSARRALLAAGAAPVTRALRRVAQAVIIAGRAIAGGVRSSARGNGFALPAGRYATNSEPSQLSSSSVRPSQPERQLQGHESLSSELLFANRRLADAQHL